MKNFWLEKRGPKKTKISVWLGASITGEEEELLHTNWVVNDHFFTESGSADKMYIPEELDKMLWNDRIGKALVHRNELGMFNGKPLSDLSILKAKWTPGEGNKLYRQGAGEYLTFFIKSDDTHQQAVRNAACPRCGFEK